MPVGFVNKLKPPRWSYTPAFIRPNARQLRKGLVGHWIMWDGGGSRPKDISNNSRHGLLTSVGWTNSKLGMALDFDGTIGQQFDAFVPNIATRSMVVTFQINSLPAAHAAPFVLCNNQNPPTAWVNIDLLASGAIRAHEFDTVSKTITSAQTFIAGDVVTAIMSGDSGNEVRLYVNGVDEGSVSVGTLFTGWSSGPVVRVDQINNASFGLNPPDMRIIDFRYYDRPITPAEATLLCDAPFIDVYPSWADFPAMFGAAPPPVTTLPLFDHHYRAMRAA